MKLGRPVRWFEFRTENMVAMTHGRGHVQDVALGATAEGKLVGLKADVISAAGAYAALAPPQLVNTGLLPPSVYDIPRIRYGANSVYPNTTVLSATPHSAPPSA